MTTKFKIGLDYGGTKIEGILLDESGKEIKRKRFNYNQNYEFVPISEFNSENDTKFINQFDNILDLDISEYKNLKEKIAFKKKHTINNPNVSKRNLELINKLILAKLKCTKMMLKAIPIKAL